MRIIAPLLCGLIFGAGLLISGMVQPAKVLAFLDIFGAWDPSLAVVMAAALAVSVPGFRLADRSSRPWFAGQYFWPGKSGIDLPLVAEPRCSESDGASSACARGLRWKASPPCRQASSFSLRRWHAG